MKRKEAVQKKEEQTLGEYLEAVKDIKNEQFEQEKALSREILRATRDLKKKGIGLTQENIVAQVCMQGDADRLPKEELLRKAEEYCRENRKQLVVQLLYAATILNIIMLFVRYTWSLIYLERIIISNSPIYMGLSVIIPIMTWIFMTTQKYVQLFNID